VSDVRIRDVVVADLPTFFDHQRDPEAVRMALFAGREREAFDAHWAAILADDSKIAQTVLVDGRVAGNVVCWESEGDRLIGYWIGREFWGGGVATAALRAFVDLVRERPLRAHVATTNAGSIRVLEKCGFVPVGRETTDVEELVYELPV
jgi:RimJ/RimL family protein N-acetyltransferase